ncbi:MAG: sulfate transporter [Gammaproteobacteria bacterium]|nr:MAG: sulfate transporter [Gammaproteobacteria bacterium]
MTMATARTVDSAVREALAALPNATVDLSAVTRADSAGLALLLGWMRQNRRRQAGIRFRGMPPQMDAIAGISALDRVLPRDG